MLSREIWSAVGAPYRHFRVAVAGWVDQRDLGGTMNLRHKVMAAGFVVSIAASTVTVLTTAAEAAEPGTRSIERLLNRDTKANGTPSYDNDGTDFDILTGLLQAVLADTPDAPVAIVTDGTLKVTGFLPTDAAFARLGENLGLTARNEERLAAKYENRLGLDNVGMILAYHFVPDKRLNEADLATSDGLVLDTAASQTTSVNV
ncbi:MAG: hypothetical protein ABI586_03270, partial [Candidatus Nanopelagicales bacterium]